MLIGKYLSNLELEITGNELEINKIINNILTVHDMSIFWQLQEHKKKPYSSQEQKDLWIKELQILQKMEWVYLYDTISNNTIITCPGFWYLCDKIENNAHLNNIPIFLIEGLRDYQKDIVTKMLTYKFSSCNVATGLGKSLILSSIAKSFVNANKRVMICVPTVSLAKQTMETVKRYIPKTGIVADGKKTNIGCDVLITCPISGQHYVNDGYECLIVDEAHTLAAETFKKLAINPNFNYRYGLSGTLLDRADGLNNLITAFVSKPVVQYDTKFGIENGFLTPIQIKLVHFKTNVYVYQKLHFMAAYGKLITQPKILEFLKNCLQNAINKNKKIIILFSTVKAGNKLKEYCKKFNIHFNVADADFLPPFYDFKNGKSNILVSNYRLCGTGIDIPQLDVIINAASVSSEIANRQLLGRVLRKADGKEIATLIDIVLYGYKNFENAEKKRNIYKTITDNIKDLEVN